MYTKNELEFQKENQLRPQQETFKDFLDKVMNNEYVVPDIQRDLVWDDEMKRKFLTTILKRYPYGSIILATTHEDNKTFILDGLQRTTTLIDIYMNCYKYADEYKSMLFYKFMNEIEEWVNGEYERLNINDETIINSLKKGFEYNFNVWKSQSTISNWEDYSVEFDYENLFNCAAIIEKKFRETYKWFRDECLDFKKQDISLLKFTGSESDVAEIFQRINEQGKPLTEVEILKAKLSIRKINQHTYANVFEKIQRFKDEQFKNLLQNFDNIKIGRDKDGPSYFDALYYAVFNPVKDNKEIMDSSIYEVIYDKKNVKKEWFKIINFIINAYDSPNTQNDTKELSQSIIDFFEEKKDQNVVSEINSMLKEVIEEVIDDIIYPKVFKINSGQPRKAPNPFSMSEVLLITGVYYKAKLNNKNISKQLIWLRLLYTTISKSFASNSTNTAISYLNKDTFMTGLDNESISRLISNDIELTNDAHIVGKILLPLILCKENVGEVYYKNFLTRSNMALSKAIGDVYEKNICNFFITDDNCVKTVKEQNFTKDEYKSDFFYINCSDEELISKYDQYVDDYFLQGKQFTQNDVDDFFDCRLKMIKNYIERKL